MEYHNRHLAVAQQRSGHAEELALAHWEVLAILHHLRVEGVRQLAHLRRVIITECQWRLICFIPTFCTACHHLPSLWYGSSPALPISASLSTAPMGLNWSCGINKRPFSIKTLRVYKLFQSHYEYRMILCSGNSEVQGSNLQSTCSVSKICLWMTVWLLLCNWLDRI